MYNKFIFTSLSLLFTSFLLISCGPSRVYSSRERAVRTPPPRGYYTSAALIITPQPGFRMNQNANGRYYHRNPQGLLYWKGVDNRFYLDKSYVRRVNYSHQEYKIWKRYRKQNRR